jgi:hypothetical protein
MRPGPTAFATLRRVPRGRAAVGPFGSRAIAEAALFEAFRLKAALWSPTRWLLCPGRLKGVPAVA